MKRVVILSVGGWEHVSTRDRLRPLARSGWCPVDAISVATQPTPDDMRAALEAGGAGAVLVLQRVMPTADDMAALAGAYDRVVFDIDDAIYSAAPELSQPTPVRILKGAARAALRGSASRSGRHRPVVRTLKRVDVCVAGNEVLASYARRYAPRVVEIPTTTEPVDAAPAVRPEVPVIVWLGVRDNLQYLQLVREPLRRLAAELSFRLRIVSTATWEDAPVPVEFVPFSESAASQALLDATVGISPLTDQPWTRGKCAMRVIQYGGHALPAIASPVGITDKVIIEGVTGLLASTEEEWLHALRQLVSSREASVQMGQRALERVRERYSNAVAVQRWQELLEAPPTPVG
jgi:hypothetical protein